MEKILKSLKAKSIETYKKNGVFHLIAHFNKNNIEKAIIDWKHKEVETKRENKKIIEFFANKDFLVVVE